jgi:two-component system response regulator NreC
MSTSNRKVRKIRIVVADDNKQMREKVVQMLQPDYEIVGTAADGNAALEVEQLLKPEIVLLDISMPFRSGVEVASELKKKNSTAKIIFLTVHEDHDFVRAALKVGASGYVVKSQMASDLLDAISSVSNGQLYISSNCVFNNVENSI